MRSRHTTSAAGVLNNAPLRSGLITEPSILIRVAPSLCSARYSHPYGASHLDFSPRIGAQVPTFPARAQLSFTPPSCRVSSGQQSGHPPDLSRVNDFSPVSTSSIRFRHVNSGLLALVSLSHT
jgi:hypothetical protein